MFSQGDKVHIMRGTHRGTEAEVIGVNGKDSYAVKFSDGSFAVINAVNVKEPAEATITSQELAQAFGVDAAEVPTEVWERLERLVPGITANVRIASV